MLHEYHVIYSVRYYPRFHVTTDNTGAHLYMNTVRRKDVKFVMLHLVLRIVASGVLRVREYFHTSLETLMILQLFEKPSITYLQVPICT
jgi:hypothetical protein